MGSEMCIRDSKYIAKDFGTDLVTGRCWGERGALPNGDVFNFDIDYAELCRRVRRFGRASPYLSRVNVSKNGFVVFGVGFTLLRGLVLDGYIPPDRLADAHMLARTSSALLALRERRAGVENQSMRYWFADVWRKSAFVEERQGWEEECCG